jgi:hypothetical protein
MAREKKVFNGKHETAHAWAQQSQNEGREGARVLRIFFEGPTIYSYGRNFPIATFHQKKGAARVVLFTLRSYSNTTSAHIQAAQGAITGETVIYCYNPEEAARGMHRSNMERWESVARAAALNLPECRKPERHLAVISNARREMERYAAYFKCGVKKYKFRYIYVESKDGGTKATEAEIKAKAKAEKERAARVASALATQIKLFRSFEQETVDADHTFTYLRDDLIGGFIQTSKGVRIPMPEALKAWAQLKEIQADPNHRTYDIGGKPFQIFGHSLRAASNTEFTVGCHRITFSELDDVAKGAGFICEPYTMKEEA